MKKTILFSLTLALLSISLFGQEQELYIGPLDPPEEPTDGQSLRDALLYDQLSFGLLSYLNQVFLASPGGSALVQCADDFEVPVGETWEISAFHAYLLMNGNPPYINVYIYEHVETMPGMGMPGALIHFFGNIADYETMLVGPPTDNMLSYDVKVNLPGTIELSTGKYWVSIVPAFFGFFEGAWIESAAPLPSRDLFNPYYVQDPTGFVAPFLTWTPATLFAPSFSSYNLSFAVEGEIQPPPVAADIPLRGWAIVMALMLIGLTLILRKTGR